MAKIITAVDDLDHAEGRMTPAEHTVRLVLDEQAVELDLTTAHLGELDKLLDPYFRVGRRPSSREIRPTRMQNRAYNTRMRAWADEHGISYRDKQGKIKYTKDLKRRFAAHLAERGETVTAAR